MFGALKDKLKNWVKKVKKDEPKEESKKETKKKPEKKKSEKKKEKKSKKEIKKPGKEAKKTPKEPLPEEIPEEKVEEKKSFFSKFKKTLTEEKFEELFEELELILLQNNVALDAVESIKENLKENVVGKSLKEINLSEELKNAIEDILIDPPNFLKKIKETIKEKKPFVIVFVGINGSGKTTTIAKIANYLLKNNLTVCLAAADTFRAASIEQIQQHADNLKIPLIKKDYEADPASVGFDAINYAKKRAIDVVLIDTAGRMQNKDSLMREMEKIVRVTQPDMKLFVGESITGNDATEQAKAFNEATDLTGIVLSKADVDEKGGTAISVSKVTGKPIFFFGTGQSYDDIEPFKKEKLIEKLGL